MFGIYTNPLEDLIKRLKRETREMLHLAELELVEWVRDAADAELEGRKVAAMAQADKVRFAERDDEYEPPWEDLGRRGVDEADHAQERWERWWQRLLDVPF